MSRLNDLYRKIILDEAKNPYHFEKKEGGEERVKAYNPICGDRFDLTTIEGSWYFNGFGCTISKASTSLMIRALEGKTRSEQKSLVRQAIRAFQDKDIDIPEILEVFKNAEQFESRKDCVLLSWQAIIKVLNGDGIQKL